MSISETIMTSQSFISHYKPGWMAACVLTAILSLAPISVRSAGTTETKPDAKPAFKHPARTQADIAHLTLAELTDPALVPPTINTSPLPEYGYDRLDYGMTIGIERTPGGRLWACWVGGGDNDKAFFVLATSDDDGETWSPPRAVLDPHDESLPLRRRTVVGNLWTDPKGRLWLFFDQSMGTFDGRAGSWFTICENPDSDQPVWSAPVRIWHGCSLNKPTVLSNDDWLLPISLWPRGNIAAPLSDKPDIFAELDKYRMANVFVSSDQGKTWTRRGGVKFPGPRFDEHMFIERRDGSIWMTARTRNGLWESTSADGGRTWARPKESPIKTASSRHFIRRLQSGNILLIKHGGKIHEAPIWQGRLSRSRLAAFLSEDDGLTWTGGLMLDKRGGVSYPDGFQAPDGTLYISWDHQRNTEGEILMARFTEDDIRACKFLGPKSRTQMLISRPNPEAVKARQQREATETPKVATEDAPPVG